MKFGSACPYTLWYKSDVTRWYIIGFLDQYMCRGFRHETVGTMKQSKWISMCRGWRLRNLQNREVVKVNDTLSCLLCIYSGGCVNNVKIYFNFFLQIWKSYLTVKANETLITIMFYSSGCVFILVVQQLIAILTVLRFLFVSNLEILVWTGGDLSHGQAQNGANFDL